MAQALNASPEELAQAGRGVRESADQLQDRVQGLTSRVEALLGGGWRGQAADAFRRDWDLWLDGARQVIGGLDRTSVLLESNGRTYGEQEDSNAGTLRSAGSSLSM